MTEHDATKMAGLAEPNAAPSLILSCSARRGGNADFAASLLRETLPAPCDVYRVNDLTARPCIACGYCDNHPGACTLDAPCPNGEPDVALPLLRALCSASAACIVSPMYFYHLPARAKALIDRAQSFWPMPTPEKPGQGKRLGAVLIGARPRGEHLFTGATLTLRYMAQSLGLTLADPLTLPGLDAPDALASRPELHARIRDYAASLLS